MALIAFEKVDLTLGGRPILAGIDVSIRKGEFLSVVGPSGCGKTSLLNLAAGLLTPSAGRITYAGKPVTGPRQDIAIVFQDYGKALLPWRTASGNIALALEAMNYPKEKRAARIAELLALIGLSRHADKFPNQLSGGMQQRLQIARCLAQDPSVLLMDEPFGAIDPITRDRLQNELLRLQSEMQKTIVFVTHDIDEAIKLGDRIAILQEGSRIAQYDTPERILTAPANDFVVDFIGRGASLKRLNLTRLSEIALRDWPTVAADTPTEAALERLRSADESALLVLDADRRPLRWVIADDLRHAGGRSLADIGVAAEPTLEPHATLSDALNELITARYSAIAVTDRSGRYEGVADFDQIHQAIREMRATAVDEARAGLRGES